MIWRPSFDANTTSRPHGDMDMEPTGCSTWKVLSSPNVGLSKADVRGLGSIELDMAFDGKPGLSLAESSTPCRSAVVQEFPG